MKKWLGRKDDEGSESRLEQVGLAVDTARLWITKSWRLGLYMAKGAYLLSERRRLFGKLGEEVYYKIQKGEMKNPELDTLVRDLDKLTKKVELEEMQIRHVRFGVSPRRKVPLDEHTPEGEM
jgi:hypothetical protein